VTDFDTIKSEYDLVLIATGDGVFTKDLRKKLGVINKTSDEDAGSKILEGDRRGVYLVFQAQNGETYTRSGKHFGGKEAQKDGVAYLHANDKKNHVEIATFPYGRMCQILTSMPQTFKDTAAYTNDTQLRLTFDGERMVPMKPTEVAWFKKYKAKLMEILKEANIWIPTVQSTINVYYGPRRNYYYHAVGVKSERVGGKVVPAILFLGDSLGGTDYMLGISLRRGMVATTNLLQQVTNVDQCWNSFEIHQRYWDDVIANDFNKAADEQMAVRELKKVFTYDMLDRIVDGHKMYSDYAEKVAKSQSEDG